MNKLITALLFTFSLTLIKAQVQLIPDSVYFVMEVDLGKIVKSISIEEINKLEFTQKMIEELSNETNNIKSISDLSVDFNSKLVSYIEEREGFSNTTAIIPLMDRNNFIELFDEFDRLSLRNNNLLIKDNTIVFLHKNNCIISTIDWKNSYFRNKVEDLYYEKEWVLPNNFYYMYGYDYENDEDYYYEEDFFEEEIEKGETLEKEVEDNLEEPFYEEYDEYDDESQEELEIRLQEVMDSVRTSEKELFISLYLDYLEQPKNNLLSNDAQFKKISLQTSDAKIYYNPSMSIGLRRDMDYMPFEYIVKEEVNEFRQFAYLNFTAQGIQIDWKIKSSNNFGKVINKSATGGLNKKLLKYIPDNAQGFGFYNINTFGAYEQLKETYLPKLDASEDPTELLTAAIWSTIDEFINMEALTSIYPPQVLFSYSGLKEVELPKVTYDYDEETFQYTEIDTTYMEKIPMINIVIANERAYLLEKYIKAMMKFDEGMIMKSGKYYAFPNDPFGLGIPYYLAIKDDIIFMTNDEDAISNHLNGYSMKAFDNSIYNKAEKSKLLYAHMDFSQLASDLASLGISNNADRFISKFDDKTSKIDFEVSSIDKNQINLSLKMVTNTKYKNGAHFLFDLINEIYLMNK